MKGTSLRPGGGEKVSHPLVAISLAAVLFAIEFTVGITEKALLEVSYPRLETYQLLG